LGLALALDEGPWLEKIGPPADPDSDEGMKTWLESLWAQGDISPQEQEIVGWQSDSDNMTAADLRVQGHLREAVRSIDPTLRPDGPIGRIPPSKGGSLSVSKRDGQPRRP
jgi:hypothetical protein